MCTIKEDDICSILQSLTNKGIIKKKSEIHINIYFAEYKLPEYTCLLLAEFKNLGSKQTSPLRLFFLAKCIIIEKKF